MIVQRYGRRAILADSQSSSRRWEDCRSYPTYSYMSGNRDPRHTALNPGVHRARDADPFLWGNIPENDQKKLLTACVGQQTMCAASQQ